MLLSIIITKIDSRKKFPITGDCLCGCGGINLAKTGNDNNENDPRLRYCILESIKEQKTNECL